MHLLLHLRVTLNEGLNLHFVVQFDEVEALCDGKLGILAQEIWVLYHSALMVLVLLGQVRKVIEEIHRGLRERGLFTVLKFEFLPFTDRC